MSIASALKKAASAAIKATGGAITYRRVTTGIYNPTNEQGNTAISFDIFLR